MKSTTDFINMKVNGEKIAVVTAYDYPQAKLAEQSGIDMILVGDSLGMVVLGYDSTVPVTIADMVHHTKAAKRGATNTFIVTDLPFMTYHISDEEAMKAARSLMQEGGCHAVKVEGGEDVVINTIKKLTVAGVPVVAHLGLTPQTAGVLGGYKVQGKTAESASLLIEEAIKCEEAGAFAIVLECIPKQLAQEVSAHLTIPTIGIGAGSGVDGQVLVYNDLLTFGVSRVPKFVKKYGDVNAVVETGLRSYVEEVKSGRFPEDKHSFTMAEEELALLYGGK
ncbi:3-methyl-2-oxobutanoate hydroxymethyltransferase [Bacillus sp. FSL K6-3431]|uniref:3-methyl-2-oxobutanoate hydroxymethyltransferase n=1 Tax=Bacillus sp. FSL K6-3431 TaxID=2921500 RepID=UPI0030FCA514